MPKASKAGMLTRARHEHVRPTDKARKPWMLLCLCARLGRRDGTLPFPSSRHLHEDALLLEPMSFHRSVRQGQVALDVLKCIALQPFVLMSFFLPVVSHG